MKKALLILSAALLLSIFAVACQNGETESSVPSTFPDTPSESTEALSSEESTIPESETAAPVEYPAFEWPAFGLSEKLPHPDWISTGKIEYDVENAFSMNAGNVSHDQFKEYVALCHEAGFTDYRTNNDKEFCAFNADGLSVYISYKDGQVLHIWIG